MSKLRSLVSLSLLLGLTTLSLAAPPGAEAADGKSAAKAARADPFTRSFLREARVFEMLLAQEGGSKRAKQFRRGMFEVARSGFLKRFGQSFEEHSYAKEDPSGDATASVTPTSILRDMILDVDRCMELLRPHTLYEDRKIAEEARDVQAGLRWHSTGLSNLRDKIAASATYPVRPLYYHPKAP